MNFVRRHPVWVSLGALVLLVVILGLLALPLRGVQADATEAQADLTKAAEAIKAGDMEEGWEHVAAARVHVDDVTDVTDGASGRVLSLVPYFGRGVGDARRLATAMDELTTALEVAEDIYPEVSGDESTLLRDGNINLATMNKLVDSVERIEDHVLEARTQLEDVHDEAPLLGTMAARKRDAALDQVRPAASGLKRMRPLVDSLPDVLGAKGERKYLLAMMNPSEMKYSGGSMLTFSVLEVEDGVLRRGKVRDVSTNPKLFRRGFWENVEGNVFASPYSERITHANVAPSWPVAGEETLRAWEWLRRERADDPSMDGLIAIDLVALSHVLRATGPLQVAGVGEVTADNLLPKLAGDYARFTPEQQAQRKSLNRRLIPAFTDRLFSGVDFVGTMKAMNQSAQERHLALYFRDEDEQAAAREVGFDGDLSQTDHDYLAVFTQNILASKADYFQRKDVVSRVKVRPDGSARVTLDATVENTASGLMSGQLSEYTDPDLTMFMATFLPRGAQVRSLTVTDSDGQRPGGNPDPTISETGEYFDRPYVRERVVARAGDSARMQLVYDVPRAATISRDTMTYRLDVDPHPTVSKAQHSTTVIWPKGWKVFSVPTDWVVTKQGHALWKQPTFAKSESFTLTATRG
ncbi:DUF4012 domain-containing protein [Nocardioides sp. Y6]|uniref:DUF4012 domain-containing protein n=1 Tax=Nocardioides malaquae TaxID=2773426 RepID=A0ABR9RUD0_9ACTN|nr:DUF4012 domain-containing protein [Nocardioides malaquae]MBE7324797.1 DUF4012 domain-containing protein [Nocardioides malaquae]